MEKENKNMRMDPLSKEPLKRTKRINRERILKKRDEAQAALRNGQIEIRY